MNVEAARRPRLLWASGVAVFVLAGLAGLGVFIAKQPYGFDLWAYVLAARHLLAGEPLYPPAPQMPAGPFGEYHYAPIVAVPFVLLAPLPFDLATAVWIGLNAGFAAAMALYLIRPLPHDARPWAAAGFIAFLPTILEISLGNLNIVTVALCLVAWSFRTHAALAGAILAVAVGTKLLPLTLVLFYLASGRTRLVAWTVTIAIAGLVVTALAFPRDFPGYLGVLFALRDSHWDTDVIASSPPPELAALLASPIGRWLLPVLALITAIAGGLATRRDERNDSHLHHLALAFAPFLAPFALLWFPYLVFALPALGSTFDHALRSPRAPTRALLTVGLALSWILLQWVGERGDLAPIAAHFLGLLVLLGVAVAAILLPRSRDLRESVAARAAA